jgi:hypothetical protein
MSASDFFIVSTESLEREAAGWVAGAAVERGGVIELELQPGNRRLGISNRSFGVARFSMGFILLGRIKLAIGMA